MNGIGKRSILRRAVMLVTALCLTLDVATAAVRPPAEVTVEDRPNDAGTGLIVAWRPSRDERPELQDQRVVQYQIFRDIGDATSNEPVAVVNAGVYRWDDQNCTPDTSYRYRLRAVAADGETSEFVSHEHPASPVVQWFDRSRLWQGVIVALVCAAVIVCTELAKRGWSTYVRPIAGLMAIDEAVGRSTEMGKPMLFVPGILDLDQIETVAGLTVLAHVGQRAAEYDTPLEVPTSKSLVMTAARETLEGAYLTAGRPEAYNEDRVHYVTDDQFGYVAAVCGWMSREKPAACFFLGKFFAESLLLAETGNSVGAIQLAGTAEPAQLPFFVAACDYTLIGEELFAASAYLSGEPQQLGTLKGQDVGKVFAGLVLVVGCVLATAVELWPDSDAAVALNYLKTQILSRGAE